MLKKPAVSGGGNSSRIADSYQCPGRVRLTGNSRLIAGDDQPGYSPRVRIGEISGLSLKPHLDTLRLHPHLGLADRVLTKVKDAGRQYCVGATFDHSGSEMIEITDPA